MRLRLFAGLLAGASLFVGPSSVGQPAVTSTFGVVGPSFAGTTVPTGTKRSESVVWWNDGSWWASMWSVRSHGFHIFRFAPILRRWLDTGSEIDRRADTEADTIWDRRHLYVATHKRDRDLI